MYVVVTGDPFDGLTIFGPFKNNDDAIDWAENNPITDLGDVPWWVVSMEPTVEEGMESTKWAIYNANDGTLLPNVYDDYDECMDDANQLDNSQIIMIDV